MNKENEYRIQEHDGLFRIQKYTRDYDTYWFFGWRKKTYDLNGSL